MHQSYYLFAYIFTYHRFLIIWLQRYEKIPKHVDSALGFMIYLVSFIL